MKVKRLLFRSLYYFRIGYSTYLALPVALLGYITVIYQLLLKNIAALAWLFPHFSLFLVSALICLAPSATILGWIHIKRSMAYKSQIDVDVEANQYNYKLLPGKETQLAYPLNLTMLKLLTRFYKKQGILTAEEEAQLQSYAEKYEHLIKGGKLDA